MIDQVNALIEARNLLNTGLGRVQPLLTDQSIPLDDRWDAYTKLVENNILVKDEIYGDGMLGNVFDRNRVSLYDDFYMDRGQNLDYPELWEMMIDNDDGERDVYADVDLRNKWRELVLASGYSSFTHDW